jgi:hypothetical protein
MDRFRFWSSLLRLDATVHGSRNETTAMKPDSGVSEQERKAQRGRTIR